MIQVPPGFDYMQFFNDLVLFAVYVAPIAVLGLGYTLVTKGAKRSGR